MDVVVSGSTGFIGSAVVDELRRGGDRAIRLVRPASAPVDGPSVAWDVDAGSMDATGLEGVDAVIHLAGAGIGDRRWNAAHKRAVLESRVRGTELLARSLAGLARPPRVLVSASAVGYYGDRGDEVLTEQSTPGRGFLADVCRAWEAAAAPAAEAGIRVVHPRTGIVLARHGGVLPRMLLPFRFGAGGRVGSGRQWMSWIALSDEVDALLHLVRAEELVGGVNFTAPEPVTNADFAKAAGRALHRPAVLPAPAAALKLALGREMASELLLAGQRAVPARLEASGFKFRHPDLEGALAAVLRG
jgi:hypothetical protein